MIDTAVDRRHSTLAGADIVVETTRSAQLEPSGTKHGTAVASLLAGEIDGLPLGLTKGVRLHAIDAFHRSSSGDRATAFDLVAALDRLSDAGVRVINLSLSGPDNDVLEVAVAALIGRGTVVVAAVGNERGSAGSGYPARYDDVIGVSAIDSRQRALGTTNRGRHVDFSAPGADILAAHGTNGTTAVRGSSFAAPFVTMAYAIGLERGHSFQSLTSLLVAQARDLGPAGHDPVYGHGLIQLTSLAQC